MKDIHITRAAPAHADAMGNLIYRSHTHSFAAFKDETWIASRKLEDYVNAWRHYWAHEPGDERTWLAWLHEHAVGVVTVGPLTEQNRLVHPTNQGDSTQIACVHGIHVDPNYLGQGMGRMLMAEALSYLRKNGYTLVTLLTDEANERARRFYEVGGWSVDAIVEKPPQMVKTVRYRAIV